MKISERTRKRLADFLGSLPAGHARALADCIEEARRAGNDEIPHDLVLEALRPALGPEGPSFGHGRTAVQVFALPFEDLIVERSSVKRRWRIARASVDTVWNWLRAGGEGTGGVADRLRLANRGGISRTAALEFYRACAQAIGQALDEGTAAEISGGDTAEDARAMAAVLEIAADALEIRERFSRSQGMLSASALNALAVMFDDFADRHPGRAALFFLLLAGRLERPWEVLRIMEQVAEQVHKTRLGAADTEAVTETLFADLEAAAEFFRRLNTAVFDPADVADALRDCTRLADGLARAGIPQGGLWARRMAACRSDVAEKMEILMERAPRDIMAALPVHKIGRFGRVRRRPHIDAPPDPAITEQALRMAKLLELCRAHAADAAFKAAFTEAAAETRAGLSEYADALMEEITRNGAEAAVCAHSWLDLVTRLTAQVTGPEEAARLRRDAAAAGVGVPPDAAAVS